MREVPGSIPGVAHVLSLPFVERDSNVGEEPGLEREGAQEQLRGTGGGAQGGMYVIPAIKTLCPSGLGGGIRFSAETIFL